MLRFCKLRTRAIARKSRILSSAVPLDAFPPMDDCIFERYPWTREGVAVAMCTNSNCSSLTELGKVQKNCPRWRTTAIVNGILLSRSVCKQRMCSVTPPSRESISHCSTLARVVPYAALQFRFMHTICPSEFLDTLCKHDGHTQSCNPAE